MDTMQIELDSLSLFGNTDFLEYIVEEYPEGSIELEELYELWELWAEENVSFFSRFKMWFYQ
jgi:hypothetical protein